MATQGVCSVEGCGKVGPLVRGYCNAHYLRWRRHGTAAAGRTPNGEQRTYMLAHMWDECPRWPYRRDRAGYGRINFAGHRAKLVHQAVCELAHGPRPTPRHEAAHSCGKGHEGCFGARCLSWKTRAENAADAIGHGTWNHGEKVNFAKLTEVQALEIWRRKPSAGRYGPAAEVAAEYGVAPETVVAIWDRRSWAWLTGRGDADGLHPLLES